MAKQSKTPSTSLGRARLSVRVWAFAFTLPALLILVGLLFTLPQSGNAQNENAAKVSAEQNEQEVRNRIAGLESGDVPSADLLLQRARELDVLLPAQLRPLEFNNALLAKAQGAGLTDVSVAVQESAEDQNSAAFAVSVSGPVQQILTFVDSLKVDPSLPLVTISDLKVSVSETTDEQGQRNSTGSFTANAWFLPSPTLDEEQEAKQDASQAAGQQSGAASATATD